MHPGKAMARLMPKHPNWGMPGGSAPTLTSEGAAFALARISDELGRELFCRIWWPDGAKLQKKRLDALLQDLQWREWRERADRLVTAQIAAAEAQRPAAKVKALLMLEYAKAQMWPRITPTYAAIRGAVLIELTRDRHCPCCGGRGTYRNAALIVVCPSCGGTGIREVSGRSRAQLIGVNQTDYRRLRWGDVYAWLLNECYRRLQPAMEVFKNAL